MTNAKNVYMTRTKKSNENDYARQLLWDIKDKIGSLKNNPRPPGCEKLTDEEGYRVRVRNYRILYRINDKDKIVFIHRVRHRREVYR